MENDAPITFSRALRLADDRPQLFTKPEQSLGERVPLLIKSVGWRRDRDGDWPADGVDHGDANRAYADAMFTKIEREAIAARCVHILEEFGPMQDGMARMLARAFVDERRRAVLRETRQDRLAVRGAMQGKSLANARKGDEPLSAWNLVDEDGGATGQNREIDRFADFVAQGDKVWMQDLGVVRTQ